MLVMFYVLYFNVRNAKQTCEVEHTGSHGQFFLAENKNHFPLTHFVQMMHSFARGTKAAFCSLFFIEPLFNALLFWLRRWFPPPSANSPAAKPAATSDTLRKAGYARSDDENCPTVHLVCSTSQILFRISTL